MSLRETEINKAIAAICSNQSLLILGEEGAGKSVIAYGVRDELESRGWTVAIAEYSSSTKNTLISIAEQLDIDIADPKTKKAFTVDEMKKAIPPSLAIAQTCLICDDAQRYPAALRYWLEDCIADGALLLMLATTPPRKDIFLKMPRISLPPLNFEEIRAIMLDEAEQMGIRIDSSKLAELQERAGGNPHLARRVIREEMLSLGNDEAGDHVQYFDGTPYLIAVFALISIVRFIGMGLGNRPMMVMGGIAMVVAMSLSVILRRSNTRQSSRL